MKVKPDGKQPPKFLVAIEGDRRFVIHTERPLFMLEFYEKDKAYMLITQAEQDLITEQVLSGGMAAERMAELMRLAEAKMRAYDAK